VHAAFSFGGSPIPSQISENYFEPLDQVSERLFLARFLLLPRVSIGNISISISIASISILSVPTCIIRIRLLSSTRSHALRPLVTSSSCPASPRDKVHLHALSCLICLGAQPEYPDSPGSCFLTSTLPPPPKPEFEPANFSQTSPSEKLRNDLIQLNSTQAP
jgi:hypothetical protein